MRLLTALLFVGSAFAQSVPMGSVAPTTAPPACTPASGYAHCRVLTTDYTQAGSSDSSYFPLLVSVTLGSSRVQNASCYDVIFTSDSGGTTKIPWEQEACTQATGAGIWWVKLATLSHTVAKTVYVSYDNASISTPQNTGSYAPTAVWDSYTSSVYHLSNGTTLSLLDSTGNANMSNCANGPSATAGYIAGGAAFTASPVICAGSSSLDSTGNRTLSFWTATSNCSSVAVQAYLDRSSSSDYLVVGCTGTVWAASAQNSATYTKQSTVAPTSAWTHIAVTKTTGSITHIYVNGADVTTTATGAFTDAAVSTIFGTSYSGGSVTAPMAGSLDEIQYATTQRSADWILAEYNNQKSGSTFLRMGSEI